MATATKNKVNRVAELQEQFDAWQEELSEDEIAFYAAQVQGYSERNSLLIAMQCPTATVVKGFKTWLKEGQCVRKGEKGIQILAPSGQSAGTEATETTDAKAGRMFFRLAFVFDIAQTDPIEKK